MAVAWYVVKCWLMTSPDGETRLIATRPQHSYTWEVWTLDKKDGTTVQIPQRVRPKYRLNLGVAYNSEYVDGDEATFPTRALMRVEYPDDSPTPLEPVDYEHHLTTQAHWDGLAAQEPTLLYRFADQPYYPAP